MLDDLAKGVDFGGVNVLGGERDIVRAKFDFAPAPDSRSSGVSVLRSFTWRTRDLNASAPLSVNEMTALGPNFDFGKFGTVCE